MNYVELISWIMFIIVAVYLFIVNFVVEHEKLTSEKQQYKINLNSPTSSTISNTIDKELFINGNTYDENTNQQILITNNSHHYTSNKRTAQQELDWYWKKNKSKEELGRDYERFVGYCYEQDGYDVTYQGIKMGLNDEGIDLICKKDNEILLVQCKRWGNEKIIYEKYIHQLYGASETYKRLNNITSDYDVFPIFVTTVKLSDSAIEAARALNITVAENFMFINDYPSIKCNINNKGERVYHLPCDPYYDITKVNKNGEGYVSTVEEAESLGFRRYSTKQSI